MRGKDLYATLELEAGADLPAVKRAYRRLAFAVRPDVGALLFNSRLDRDGLSAIQIPSP